MNTKRNRLHVESLEDRRMLAITIAGLEYLLPPLGEEVGYVSPPQSGFSPIALPNGITPPGTTQLSPPAGELPPGMPPLSGLGESNASALGVGWMYNHTDAVGTVSSATTVSSYSATLTVRDGVDFFTYTVPETADLIGARFALRDGTHSEILASSEVPSTLDGGLVYAQFDNDILTAMAVHSQIAGVDTVWTYPEALPVAIPLSGGGVDPGLSSPAALAALDDLIAAHLNGPAADQTLANFNDALGDYFAQVPEPSTLVLAAALAPLVPLAVRHRRRAVAVREER